MNASTQLSFEKPGEIFAKIFQLSSNLQSLITFEDGRFIEVNDAFLTTLGYVRAEVIGKTVEDLGLYLAPGDRQQLLQAAAKDVPLRNIEVRFRGKNGVIHDTLFSAETLTINGIKCWICSASDISALKQTERLLREQETKYRNIVENQAEFVCRYQPDGKLTFVNTSYANYFGKSVADLIGHNFIPYIPADDLPMMARHLTGITRDNPATTFEHRVIMPGGEVRWQQWSHRGIFAADGSLVEYQAVGRDITIFKRAEQMAVETAEQKFKALFDQTGAGIALVHQENKHVYIGNSTFCRMLGYNGDEIHNLTFTDIHPEQDRPYVSEQFERMIRGELNFVRNIPVKRKDHSVFYADIYCVKIAIEGKHYLAGIFHDITERKKAEEDLVLAHMQLKSLIDAASQVSIIATDISGLISTFNRGSELMLGYSAEEMIGKQTPCIVHLATEIKARGEELTKELGYPVEGYEVFTAYAKQGKFDEREWTYVKKDGKQLTVDLIVTAVKDQSGAISGFLGIAIDISDRIRALQAQAANAAKSQFVAHISHEIRTPLNGILGICELLVKTKMTKEQMEYAQLIDSSANVLLNIINATLDLSKIEAGKIELEQLDFNLRDTAEDVVSALATTAFEKKLELTCWLAPEVPLHLHGDPGRLRQILYNIIGNAIKFTTQGEIAVTITLAGKACPDLRDHYPAGKRTIPEATVGTTEIQQRQKTEHQTLITEHAATVLLHFAVRDTGIGIPADKTKIIFDAFTQADASLTRRYGGTGLGLAIAKGLVEQMGGTIGVEGNYGQGSNFWFNLPFAPQKNADQSPEPQVDFDGTSILVVDTSATARMILAQQLQGWKIRVETAANGTEALRKMHSAADHKNKFTAAIIDLHMPEMDGFQLGKVIKSKGELKSTTLILTSSMGLLPGKLRRHRSLFAAILLKPIRTRHLFDNLCIVLKGRTRNIAERKLTNKSRTRTRLAANKRLHILVAEDNRANQQIILSILRKMGHAAKAVTNGQDAIRALKTSHYDLVLMDIQMPEMDGMAATALIRAPQSQVRDHNIPIIALTAYAMTGDREKCLAAGMNGYITKPISMEMIADIIAKIGTPGRISADSSIPVHSALQPEGKPPDNNAAISTVPFGTSIDVFDSETFTRRVSGKSGPISTIIDITLEELPKLIQKLEQSVKHRQADAAGRLVHNIKGGAANVSGNRLLAVVFKLGMACNTGDWQTAENLLPELNRQFAALEREMREFQKTLK